MYMEAVKSLGEMKSSLLNSRLKSVLKEERHEEERESWQREAQVRIQGMRMVTVTIQDMRISDHHHSSSDLVCRGIGSIRHAVTPISPIPLRTPSPKLR